MAERLAQVLWLVCQSTYHAIPVADLEEVSHEAVAHECVQRDEGQQNNLHLLALAHPFIDLPDEQQDLRQHVQLPA